MQRLQSIHSYPTHIPYIAGEFYEGKGVYLGETKGAHKFQRHNVRKFQHMDGRKYHFEKVR